MGGIKFSIITGAEIMKAYIGIKYYEDFRNRNILQKISLVLENRGYETSCIVRDTEQWGLVKLEPNELMKATFDEIDSCDIVIIDLSEKGVGLGIEAGYAFVKGIPIITIAEEGSDISTTMQGISRQVFTYRDIDAIEKSLMIDPF